MVAGSNTGEWIGDVTPTGANLKTVLLSIFHENATTSESLDLRQGEIAYWDVELMQAEITSLSLGFSPLFIRPASLRHYWPLIGRLSPEVCYKSTNSGTITGTTTTDHPKVFYPAVPFVLDPVVAQLLFERAATDGVFVPDYFYRLEEHLKSDGVLVVDTLVRFIEAARLDGLLVADTVARLMEAVRADGFLLSDLSQTDKGRFITAIEHLLLSDTRTSLLDMLRGEHVLLSDVASKLREMLVREGLYVVDSSTVQEIEAAVAALVYALLRARDAVGVSLASRDPVGVSVDDLDPMGIVLNVVYNPKGLH